MQKSMRAAGYGKSFLSDYDSDEFVECCRKLRVLNNCRHESCGMPLTSHQYDRLTPEVRTAVCKTSRQAGRAWLVFPVVFSLLLSGCGCFR